MQLNTNNVIRFLRLPDVKNRTGLSRSSIYAHIKKGTFPLYINLGARSVGWLESEINEWISARLQTRQKAGGESGK